MTPVLASVASLPYVAAEGAVGLAVLLIFAWDLLVRGTARAAGTAFFALAALAYAIVRNGADAVSPPPAAFLFDGQLAFDPFANTFRLFLATVTLVVVLLALPTPEARSDRGGGGAGAEFIALLLVVSLGMSFLAMACSLLMIYLAIEILSVISFVLSGYKLNDRKGGEAALKYVIFGGVASGVMLYGMSWIYGLAGSLSLSDIASAVAIQTRNTGHLPAAWAVAIACLMAGFAYKISAVPFHMWTPDVYEGAPTLVTAFLAVGPKAAGFAVLVRFFHQALGAADASLLPHGTPWPLVAGALAVATMTVGNVSALGQANVKRLLAFSSIAHAGYMLLAFAVFNETGIAALVFYAVSYAAMNLGAFLVVLAVAETNGGDESVSALQGLGVRAPAMAAAMAMFLFSLVGLPPFAGFVGKLYVFTALLSAPGPYHGFYLFLAVAGVVNTVISLVYYARILRVMYLEAPAVAHTLGGAPAAVAIRRSYGVAAALLVVPTVALGIYWGPAYDFVARSLAMAP